MRERRLEKIFEHIWKAIEATTIHYRNTLHSVVTFANSGELQREQRSAQPYGAGAASSSPLPENHAIGVSCSPWLAPSQMRLGALSKAHTSTIPKTPTELTHLVSNGCLTHNE